MLRVKKMREDSGLTQQKLAELSGLDERWIRKLESGEISIENITILNMVKLLKGLSEFIEDDYVFDDFVTLKSAYMVTRSLIRNQT